MNTVPQKQYKRSKRIYNNNNNNNNTTTYTKIRASPLSWCSTLLHIFLIYNGIGLFSHDLRKAEMTFDPRRSFQKNMAAVDIDVPVDPEPQLRSPEELER